MGIRYTTILFGCFLWSTSLVAQITINEASSRNFRTIADEDGEYPDWIELYNASDEWVNLIGHTLTDDIAVPDKWTFPSMGIAPHGYLIVFCSGKDRVPRNGQNTVVSLLDYAPNDGWSTHNFQANFAWDGYSNILIETCGTNEGSFSANAILQQTTTAFPSTAFVYSDSVSTLCGTSVGNLSHHRPVVKINGVTIGDNDWQNSSVQFPSPYGNYYYASKHAMLFRASELLAAGLSAGNITSVAFNVIDAGGAAFESFDLRVGHVPEQSASTDFIPWYGAYNFHTNFGLGRGGEDVYLFAPGGEMVDEMRVEQEIQGHSYGASQDGASTEGLFDVPTPGASNNGSTVYSAYAEKPELSLPSTISATSVTIAITDLNAPPGVLRYTLDGSDPTAASTAYSAPITINSSAVLKVRSFVAGKLPSKVATASYLIGTEHNSPVLSLVTDNGNLYGPTGIFERWWEDEEIPAHVDYFGVEDTLLFSQRTGMQVDGGFGGSRSAPQKSFRLELDNSALGSGSVNLPLIPGRPERTEYSRLYLRNGSNQHYYLPHKDAAQVKMMAGATNSYYSAWTPVTVYLNGSYHGLYELREKFDAEYFKTLENADPDSMDLLTVSSWTGPVLRPNVGSANGFWEDFSFFRSLDPLSVSYWMLLNERFDLTWYTDYMIGQQWMGTTDWPYNNIKVYRSNATDQRWRFCTIDLETALAPNGQTDPTFNALIYSSSQDPEIPFTNLWQRSIQNSRYHDYYINRAADVMNSAYLDDRLVGIEEDCFDQTRPDMGDHYFEWIGTDTVARLAQYTSDHEAFLSDLTERTPVMRDDIQQFFNLPRQVDVTLDVHPLGAGKIHISTLVPDSYPWEGVYFDGVPVRIEAVGNPGYVFHHWDANGLLSDLENATFLDTLEADAIEFDAWFEEDFSAIRELTNGDFRVYPNPTTDRLTLYTEKLLDGTTNVRVTDALGTLVSELSIGAGRRRSTIDMAGLAAGPYQVVLTREGGRMEVLRFVKM